MLQWAATVALGALGFMLGFFYTRTMGVADRLPELYVTKEECRGDRGMCRHYITRERDELMERIDRIESKLDRLIERLLTGEGGQHAR